MRRIQNKEELLIVWTLSILCSRQEEIHKKKKYLWDCTVRWDRTAGISLAPVFPDFASWWCSFFEKQLYRCAFCPPHPAGKWDLGWRGFPCHGHKCSTSSLPLFPCLQNLSVQSWLPLLKLLSSAHILSLLLACLFQLRLCFSSTCALFSTLLQVPAEIPGMQHRLRVSHMGSHHFHRDKNRFWLKAQVKEQVPA